MGRLSSKPFNHFHIRTLPAHDLDMDWISLLTTISLLFFPLLLVPSDIRRTEERINRLTRDSPLSAYYCMAQFFVLYNLEK